MENTELTNEEKAFVVNDLNEYHQKTKVYLRKVNLIFGLLFLFFVVLSFLLHSGAMGFLALAVFLGYLPYAAMFWRQLKLTAPQPPSITIQQATGKLKVIMSIVGPVGFYVGDFKRLNYFANGTCGTKLRKNLAQQLEPYNGQDVSLSYLILNSKFQIPYKFTLANITINVIELAQSLKS